MHTHTDQNKKMGFCKHYKAMLKKNFIVYKRNWRGSIYEM